MTDWNIDVYTYNAAFVIKIRFHLNKTIYGSFRLVQVINMIEAHLYLNDYIESL
jgi:hypothetical protein